MTWLVNDFLRTIATWNYDEILVHTSIINNGTRVKCFAQGRRSGRLIYDRSEEVLLLVYGE